MPLPHSSLNPREKLAFSGPESLSLKELWACVLGQGSKKRSVFQLAQDIAKLGSSLEDLSRSADQLKLPPTQLLRIKALCELSRRSNTLSGIQLLSPRDVEIASQELKSAKQEKIMVWYCDTRAAVIHKAQLAQGSLNAASLAPREIFSALRHQHFDSLVLVHNHPSGDPEPSSADIVFTRRMKLPVKLWAYGYVTTLL